MIDLTRAATPLYFATMALERRVLARRAAAQGPSRGDYQRPDTLTSLTMGTLSLGLPFVSRRLVRAFAPGRGRWARHLAGATAAAVVATTVADRVVRRSTPRGVAEPAGRPAPLVAGNGASAATAAAPQVAVRNGASVSTGATTPVLTGNGSSVSAGAVPVVAVNDASASASAAAPAWAVSVQRAGGVAAVAGATLLATAVAADRFTPARLWRSGRKRDLGTGPLAWLVALVGWDLIYYWNHRLMHEVRGLWAHHVVHHSSERYNLSTALRQPVSPIGVWVPYGLLASLGVRPSMVEYAHGINLLYQYWVHTEAVDRIGPAEEVLNSPSHHRVHHGSNSRYIDRNHGGILIVWDRLFGTFERERAEEPVVYGLTRNVGSFHPLRVATHEYVDMAGDIARSTTWRDRVSYVLRTPGWAYRRRAEQLAAAAADDAATAVPSASAVA